MFLKNPWFIIFCSKNIRGIFRGKNGKKNEKKKKPKKKKNQTKQQQQQQKKKKKKKKKSMGDTAWIFA